MNAGALRCFDKDVDDISIWSQHEICTFSDDDKGFASCHGLKNICLNVKQVIVGSKVFFSWFQHCGEWHGCQFFCQKTAVQTFIHIDKQLFIDAAFFGSHRQNLALIARNTKFFGQCQSDTFSTCTEISGNGNYIICSHFLTSLTRSIVKCYSTCSFYSVFPCEIVKYCHRLSFPSHIVFSYIFF